MLLKPIVLRVVAMSISGSVMESLKLALGLPRTMAEPKCGNQWITCARLLIVEVLFDGM